MSTRFGPKDRHCCRTSRWDELGTVSIAGADFAFAPVHAVNSVFDSCGASQNEDPAQTGPAAVTMKVEQDESGWPTLRLVQPTGEEILLEKCRDCQ